MSEQADQMKELLRASRASRMETHLLIECVQRRIITLRDQQWDEEAIEQARRARRLMRLGVNMSGIEIIVHMRERVMQMQREMEQLRAEMDSLQARHEQEISRLLRELSR